MAKQPVLIVLAGGASSRMWPLREKSLLRFGADPLMAIQLKRYAALGFKQAIIVANPASREQIADLAASIPDLNVAVVVQQTPRGMGDALLMAEPALPDPHVPIYVTQVHDVVDEKLHQDMLKAFGKNADASYLAGYEMDDYFPGGYLVVDGDQITGIVEKPGAENRPSNLVNIVAHIHADAGELFDAIRAEYSRDLPSDDHYERAMDALMTDARTYRVVPYSGHWSALKYPWHVLDIMAYFLDQIDGQVIAEDAFVAKTATLVGNVYIGAGARVFPGAAVVGPAYVGAGAIVGNNALVRNSMVLDGCEVGFTTEVARSYVGPGCAMHACRVLDTVFAENVNFSAGCTTANLRIDRGLVNSKVKGEKLSTGRDKFGAVVGRDAFLAVDVMTMPGVKVGERAQVGPGTHVVRDVPDDQRVYVKQQLEVVDHDPDA